MGVMPGSTWGPSDPSTTGPEPPRPSTTGPEPDPDSSTGLPGGSSSESGSESSTGGFEPGGVGPDPQPDDKGDVALPSADVVAAAVYTDGESADFRVQLVEPPFTAEATYNITWCIESGPGGSGSCATHADNIDAYLQLFHTDEPGLFESGTPGIDCTNASFEDETNTLRIVVPVDTFPGTEDFSWILTVTFGGSGGDNEWVPEEGDLPVTFVDELPLFGGSPVC